MSYIIAFKIQEAYQALDLFLPGRQSKDQKQLLLEGIS